MIIDNKSINNSRSSIRTVWDYLKRYTGGDEMSIVTGYFTISALTLLKNFEHEPKKFRLILSEIAGTDNQKERIIDLLQDNNNLSEAFKLHSVSRKAIDFLRQESVKVKRINNAFCHAKTYIYDSRESDDCFYLTGSSNLTEKGLGVWESSNVELNVAHKGADDADFGATLRWFNETWENAATDTIELFEDGKKLRKTVKQYFIDCIENFCREYTPKEIYYKILYELFKDDIALSLEEGNSRSNTRLEDSAIWNILFDFQQKGVRSLISMMTKYNGAILADAVGLGKTFSALAVIKYFQSEGYFTLVLCPKKLQANWQQYLSHQGSRFERDEFDYEVRFHTDLQEGRLDSYGRAPLSFLKSRPKMLIVIDESHNLRNDKSGRYKFLMDELIKNRPHDDIKILELSATPINNHILDVRNQFKIIAHDAENAFNVEDLKIPHLTDLFRKVQAKIAEWNDIEGERHIRDLVESLPDAFFNLTDRMVVARTRQMVEKATGKGLKFPKQNPPINIFRAMSEIGELATFEDIYNALLAPNLVAYQPSAYTKKPEEKVKVTEDQRQREFFLCKMMMILFLKRLESSWVACKATVENVLAQHEHALEKVNMFIAGKASGEIEIDTDFGEDDDADVADMSLGKKNPIRMEDIVDIEQFKADLKEDIRRFHVFVDNMNIFAKRFEDGAVKDSKLEKLREVVKDKVNVSHKKVLIFTSYSDTARYIYEQLSQTFPGVVAVVDGSGAEFKGRADKNFQKTLWRFSPNSKLYKELDWIPLYKKYYPQDDKHFDYEKRKWNVSFAEWKKIVEHFKDCDSMARMAWEALQEPIRILIATDCLSEGQNLQDAQTVINYDVHWNPTRLIQRQGRIDRIGSDNTEIDCVNFWPAKNYENYLGLFSRVNNRMAAMALMGTETLDISEKLKKELEDNPILDRNDAKMLEEVKETGKEQSNQSFGLQDLSLESFRQDLFDMLKANEEMFKMMPKGIYSGFRTEDDLFHEVPESIVALVQAKDSKEKFLILRPVNDERDEIVKEYNRQEILTILRTKRDLSRFVPKAIDRGEPAMIAKLGTIMQSWFNEIMPKATEDAVGDMMSGAFFAETEQPQEQTLIEETFKQENMELLVWEYISKK